MATVRYLGNVGKQQYNDTLANNAEWPAFFVNDFAEIERRVCARPLMVVVDEAHYLEKRHLKLALGWRWYVRWFISNKTLMQIIYGGKQQCSSSTRHKSKP